MYNMLFSARLGHRFYAVATGLLLALLALPASAAMIETTYSSAPGSPQVIPDAVFTPEGSRDLSALNMVQSTIVVPEQPGVADLIVKAEVEVALNHNMAGDLVIFLEAPDGTIVHLLGRPGYPFGIMFNLGQRGGVSSNFEAAHPIRFSDDAEVSSALLPDGNHVVIGRDTPGVYRPSWDVGTPWLSDLNDMSAAGTWTLHVGDGGPLNEGELESWSLILTIIPEPGSVAVMSLGVGALLLRRRRATPTQ